MWLGLERRLSVPEPNNEEMMLSRDEVIKCRSELN
jgi:hypothetical protein